MATEFSKKLKEIYKHHDLQATTLTQLTAAHTKLRKRKGNSIEDMHDSNQPLQVGTPVTLDEKSADHLKLLYQNTFVAAAEEVRIIGECIEKMKKFAQRRDAKEKRKKLEEKDLETESTSTVSHSRHSSSSSHSNGSTGASSTHKSSATTRTKGDIWSHDVHSPLPRNSEIAALVDSASVPPLWILATIIDFHPSPTRPRYEVLDADPGESEDGGPMPRKKYMLPPKKVIPLPSLDQVPLNKRKEFGKGQTVLALFPSDGITVLYPAVVIKTPKQTKSDNYLLEFSDDDGEHREVDARYVAPLQEEEQDAGE